VFWRREQSVYVSTKVSVGALAKLRKATIGIVISVSLSVRKEQLGSHCTGFHEI
jgi:hypothetical protein